MPPPRRRGRARAALLVCCALVVVVIGVIYYESDYKPRHYLQNWSVQMGTPAGNFAKTNLGGDNHTYTMRFEEHCYPSTPCSPPPVKAIGDWVEADGGSVEDDTITDCFRNAESFSYYHAHHPVTIRCEQVNSTQFNFIFTAVLGY
jgi:hypothetical protein